MPANRFATAMTAAVLLLCPATAAWADRSGDTAPPPPAAGPGDEPTGSVTIAPGSGADLIRLVEKSLPGTRVYDLNLSDDGAAPYFEVKAERGGSVWTVIIDAATRKILRAQAEMPISELGPEVQRELAGLRRARMQLSEAVVIAEKLGRGRAISAGLHLNNGKLIFVVVVVSNGELKELTVSPEK
ncbi:hypothetical protein DNX69_07145 [Rhodopseudomonas palustris]|uniref:PepSY domain-containing protein n=1 Tax=Rhodopseudomonas palustris TaxID=1076 RepID=A0A323UNX3_RHOPL|nr:PepSY domain-containing protein [Rhodopseudomonas palustris]PZA12776.1 hypothetical protein DNX69_07145 [Rhodopseudomonas palustris]